MPIRSVNWLKMHVMSLCHCWLGRRDQVCLRTGQPFTVRTDHSDRHMFHFLQAQWVICFYVSYPFVYIGKASSRRKKSFTVIIRNSDICLTINSFLSWPKDDKI